MDPCPLFKVRLRVISVPFSSVEVVVTLPLGVVITSVADHAAACFRDGAGDAERDLLAADLNHGFVFVGAGLQVSGRLGRSYGAGRLFSLPAPRSWDRP